ncbi:FecR domain-containing protein [Niabella yanshanensis]|uniref:FecR domain-containing protein n=1 Tax=Niabella yanshanensis TaxID=577386 RepID=A0ABZ0W303_9BACT|nr:FecR domain-containing protein [Niabella yanshanensis]WQD37501.1 FecR domain-containing protein [Niabella yanshanensis]
MQDLYYYKNLVHKWGRQSISEEEKGELFTWINEKATDDELLEIMQDEYSQEDADGTVMPLDMQERIMQRIFHTQDHKEKPVRRLWTKRIAWAAAAVFVMVIAGYMLQMQPAARPEVDNVASVTADITAPVFNRAVITMGNGKTVYVDSIRKGQVLRIPGGVLRKSDLGDLEYTMDRQTAAAGAILNTLSNPKGSKIIHIKLSDGSVVWLNAGSSITYPVVFNQSTRKVSMDGEAYFDIAHDKQKPFIVSKNGVVNIEVLGTRFNVAAYQQQAKVTLLEGSVKISADSLQSQKGKFKMLKPGQQAVVSKEAIQLAGTDVARHVAWKEGFFSFKNDSLSSVLRQLAVWYDLEIVYNNPDDQRLFNGELSRSLSLKQVLAVLEESNVSFKIEGKKLIVAP